MFHVPNKYRVRDGFMGSDDSAENNGQFVVKTAKLRRPLMCQASDGLGWEHVSVSLCDRCPTWDEMTHIKSIFWDSGDIVVQIHPPQSEYVNKHQFCLHLWRKCGTNDYLEMPSKLMV